MGHPLATDEIQRLKLLVQCKRTAEEDDTPLRHIFDDVCRQSSQEAAQNVSFARIESSMYKRRRLTRPTLPTNHDDADSTVRHSRYAVLDGDVFYRGVASAADDGKALIFATTQQLEMLQSSNEVFFDATFKVVPSLYYQLMTIFASHRDSAFPAVYILMTRKTQALYQSIFAMLKELVPTFTPTQLMADFEEASVAAFRQVFGDVSVAGCWFHYCQAIVKRVQKLGLKEAYMNRDDVKNVVRCVLGLPLLPASAIPDALQDIRSTIHSDMHMTRELQQLCNYIQRQWLDKRSIGPERITVRDTRARTNNMLESYHAALRRRIQVGLTVLGHYNMLQ